MLITTMVVKGYSDGVRSLESAAIEGGKTCITRRLCERHGSSFAIGVVARRVWNEIFAAINIRDERPRRRLDLQLNPWLLPPGPGLCRSGICRLEIYRPATYQLARSGQPAADEEGPQQLPFPPKPKTQC
jgi:hypothetical protein